MTQVLLPVFRPSLVSATSLLPSYMLTCTYSPLGLLSTILCPHIQLFMYMHVCTCIYHRLGSAWGRTQIFLLVSKWLHMDRESFSKAFKAVIIFLVVILKSSLKAKWRCSSSRQLLGVPTSSGNKTYYSENIPKARTLQPGPFISSPPCPDE